MKPRLVVDTSVLCWSEELPAHAPLTDQTRRDLCVAVMESIFKGGFLLAMSDDLYDECQNQLSKDEKSSEGRAYARKWFMAMDKGNRIPDLPVPAENRLTTAETVQMTAAMVKDAHLVESALSSDLRIIALDRPVLNDWIEYCDNNPLPDVILSHPRIPSIVWVDPGLQRDGAIAWLEKEAPPREHWTIGARLRCERGS